MGEAEEQNTADSQSKKSSDVTGKNKENVVNSEDGDVRVSDAEARPTEEISLTADVSADVAPAVEEFMDQAKQQNEAAADAVPEVRDKPGSYISFEKVSK